MKDRFVRGLVAGLIGGAFSAIYSYFGNVMGLTTLPVAEWIAIFLFAHTPPFSFGTCRLLYNANRYGRSVGGGICVLGSPCNKPSSYT